MGYYRGHQVPSCFGKWDGNDPECEACTVDNMCIEKMERMDERRSAQPSRSLDHPRTTSIAKQPTHSMLGAPPTREEVLPREGEHWMSRLGKNMASASLSAAGTEVAYFFRYWRFD